MSAHPCTCLPCTSPAYGVPGREHCAACCYGTGIGEYDLHCPNEDHKRLAAKQLGLVAVPSEGADGDG